MKYMMIFLLMLPLNLSAQARDWSENSFRALSVLTMTADWRQTRWMTKNYDKGYTEKNKFLGRRPTTHEVDRYFTMLVVRHYLINRLVTNTKVRWWFNVYTFGTHAPAVYNNYKIGIQFDF